MFVDEIGKAYTTLVTKMLILKECSCITWYEYFYRSMLVSMYLNYLDTENGNMFSTEEYNHVKFKILDILQDEGSFEFEGVEVLPDGTYRITDDGLFRIIDTGDYRVV